MLDDDFNRQVDRIDNVTPPAVDDKTENPAAITNDNDPNPTIKINADRSRLERFESRVVSSIVVATRGTGSFIVMRFRSFS